jgi:hypothetical protein
VVPACVTVKVCPAMVTFAERVDVEVLAATLYPTEPLPVPLVPLVIVIQDTGLEAVHVHAAGSVTATVPCAPPEPTEALTGAIVAVQTTPACVTVNVSLPIVSVPVRLARVGFAAIAIETVPSPDPLAPDVTEIHVADGVAVHEQPASVSTLMLLLVAPAGTDVLTGEIENVQACPACVTVNVCPPTVIVPLRDVVVALVATL